MKSKLCVQENMRLWKANYDLKGYVWGNYNGRKRNNNKCMYVVCAKKCMFAKDRAKFGVWQLDTHWKAETDSQTNQELDAVQYGIFCLRKTKTRIQYLRDLNVTVSMFNCCSWIRPLQWWCKDHLEPSKLLELWCQGSFTVLQYFI